MAFRLLSMVAPVPVKPRIYRNKGRWWCMASQAISNAEIEKLRAFLQHLDAQQ